MLKPHLHHLYSTQVQDSETAHSPATALQLSILSIFGGAYGPAQKEKKSKKKKKEDKEMLVNIRDTVEKIRLATRIFGDRKGSGEL